MSRRTAKYPTFVKGYIAGEWQGVFFPLVQSLVPDEDQRELSAAVSGNRKQYMTFLYHVSQVFA